MRRRKGPIKSNLPAREIEICLRLKEIRERLGLTQSVFAGQIGLSKDRQSSYEQCRASLKFDLALRICRQFIVSEEWLATGKFCAVHSSATAHGIEFNGRSKERDELDQKVFIRQAMDLLSDPICHRIPVGCRFSEAYDKFLAERYAALVKGFFYEPRIVMTDEDGPELGLNLIQAYNERLTLLLSNQALILKVNPGRLRRVFFRALCESSGFFFKLLGGNLKCPPPEIMVLAIQSPKEIYKTFGVNTESSEGKERVNNTLAAAGN